jgi:photosystem II stability/assembly factor-like uncharacterized protein
MRDVMQRSFAVGRRMASSASYFAAAALVGVVGCGGGDGGGGDEPLRLAVGSRLEDGEPSKALILRDQGDGWVSVGENVADAVILAGAVFSSKEEVWAYGGGLVRSTDAGRTWEDMTGRLPPEVRDGPHVLRALAFADARTGYLGTYRLDDSGFPLDGPFVWVTHDRGGSWDRVEDVEVVPGEVGFMLGVRGGVAEIARHAIPGPGTVVDVIAGAEAGRQTVAASPSSFLDGFRTVGTRGWIAFSSGPDFAQSRPTILSSARPGAPWISQPVPDGLGGEFGGLDMCDATVGIAGGTDFVNGFQPVILWTDDGGDAWHRSEVTGTHGALEFGDVACVDHQVLLTAQFDIASGSSVLFESDDGGRTFAAAAPPIERATRINGFAVRH